MCPSAMDRPERGSLLEKYNDMSNLIRSHSTPQRSVGIHIKMDLLLRTTGSKSILIQKTTPLILLLMAITMFSTIAVANPQCDVTVAAGASIQAALDDAESGDVVCVAPGTFSENLVMGTSHVTLTAADENNPPSIEGSAVRILVSEADSVRIQGLEIRDGTHGIRLENSDGVQIVNNTITENNFGIQDATGSVNALVSGNTITDNRLRGISFSDSEYAVIADNIIRNNAQNASGLSYAMNIRGDSTTVTGNIFENNADQAIRAEGSNLFVEDNTFIGHETGVVLLRTPRNRADDARVINNTFTGNETGLEVQSSNVEVHGNTFSGNLVDLLLNLARNAIITDNVMETGISLDVSGAATPQEPSFDHHISGNTVDDRPLFFARETESPSIPENAAQIFLYDVQDAVISEKTFEGLAAGIIVAFSSDIEISDNVMDGIGGHAIGVWMSEEVQITGNSVSNSGFVSRKSGITVSDSPETLVQNNSVTNSSTSGIELIRSSNSTVDDNTATDNQRHGFYVTSASNDVTVSNNTAQNNGQAGIQHVANSRRGLITGNTVTDNGEQGIYDGGSMNSHESVISDNIITGNGSEGIDFRSSNLVITGNTVSGNGGRTAAIFFGRESHVANNMVTDNDSDGMRVGLISTVRDNVLTGNTGIGMIMSFARDALVSNNEVRDNGGIGIRITSTDNAVIDSNTVTGHDTDLLIHEASKNATVRNNDFESGVAISSFDGLLAELDHTFVDNTVRDGAPLFFARNEDGPEIPPEAGQIIIVSSSNIDISGFDLPDMAAGIQIIHCENVRIADNTLDGNSGDSFNTRIGAITVWGTPDLVIENNTLTNAGGYGVSIFNSPGAHVANNQYSDNMLGARFFTSPRSVFRHNTVTGSGFLGFELVRSDSMTVIDNIITDSFNDGGRVENSFMVAFDSNTVANNGRHGVFFESSDSLFIRGNVVTDNTNSGLESHFGFRSSDGATITGNTVTENGSYGINFPVNGIYVANNNIRNNENGILVANPALVEDNRIVGNSENGLVVNVDATDVLVVNNSIRRNGAAGLAYNRTQPLMAVNNWWGNASGPSGGAEDPETGATAGGGGDAVSSNVRFDPWLTTDPFGETETSADDADAIAAVFALEQNYPNPFNPTTQIRYHLPVDADVRLAIFTVLGERIATLVNERQQAGAHEIMLDASHLASGVYIYHLKAGDFVSTRKMLLVR